jgi:hypothetical protein
MLVIEHLKGHVSPDVLVLKLLKQDGETLLRAGSRGFVLGRKGYSIFILVSMPLVPHSFILFQSSTLAEHPSFIFLTEGKVHGVNYPAVTPRGKHPGSKGTDVEQRRPRAGPGWAQAGQPSPVGPAHSRARLPPPLP